MYQDKYSAVISVRALLCLLWKKKPSLSWLNVDSERLKKRFYRIFELYSQSCKAVYSLQEIVLYAIVVIKLPEREHKYWAMFLVIFLYSIYFNTLVSFRWVAKLFNLIPSSRVSFLLCQWKKNISPTSKSLRSSETYHVVSKTPSWICDK